MRFAELAENISAELDPCWIDNAAPETNIRGISYDSRVVAPGDLFVALRGSGTDGHRFVRAAGDAGAVALLVEKDFAGGTPLPTLGVTDSRAALAQIAAPFFGNPARELALVGITGTNGKTSTCTLVESILRAAGRTTGLIGTVEIRFRDEHVRSINTTPESLDLQRTLRAMCTAGVDVVAMEVSSHGLALGRVTGCVFRIAALSNVTQDHLDFHGDMDGYVEAKALLFRDYLAEDGCAVINLDDSYAKRFVAATRERGAACLLVSAEGREEADLRVLSATTTVEGTELRIATPDGIIDATLPLIGALNIENGILAAGVGAALGISREHIAAGLARCPQVPGRLERILGDTGSASVFVDYAHTPDALAKLLRTLRPLTEGRLIAVFGCGGDRDRGKRPLMAEAVARHADIAIATSDNPRTEDPESILDDVEAGLAGAPSLSAQELARAMRGYIRIADRRTAIRAAIEAGNSSDTVVLAGKGHEDYQIIGRERLPFDDRDEARRVLQGAASAEGRRE
ncbi:MAG: UDP-N-acetylmuramoyl-L-alanyl-D-glutamate--2,6-diaminopimelate ligase [Myxococcales bacterium]|nr:UDP-N-acetylmuramoyl-L-alanyl-D-glutamate--2,6-diaminopimelate ligase [Myxococcales bacterium]